MDVARDNDLDETRGPGRPPVGGAGVPTHRRTIRLPEPLARELAAEAERRGVSVDDVIREALALYLERLRQTPVRSRRRRSV